MKKSLLWLSAGMVFILALKAQLPMLADLFSASTKQAVVSSPKPELEAPTGGPAIRYVTPTGAGSKDGSSWATASDNLQAMIDSSCAGDQVWVAGGTYVPDNNVTNGDLKTKTFTLKTGVAILGGFAGTESTPDERGCCDKTILSGDPAGNDSYLQTPFTGQEENYYHVVTAIGVNSILLDGLTIIGGNASDGQPNRDSTYQIGMTEVYYDYGGGIYVDDAVIQIQNCQLNTNTAAQGGAALNGINCAVSMVGCEIVQNYTRHDFYLNEGGDGILAYSKYLDGGKSGGALNFPSGNSGVQLDSCLFDFNKSTYAAGALYVGEKTGGPGVFSIKRCTFTYNNSENRGGAIVFNGTGAYIERCYFISNATDLRGGAFFAEYYGYKTYYFANSVFAGNTAGYGGAICDDYENEYQILNCTFYGNESTQDGGGAFNQVYNDLSTSYTTSTGFANCILWGNKGTGTPTENQVKFSADSDASELGFNLIQDGTPDNTSLDSANIHCDPRFIDPDNIWGADNQLFTQDDGLRLMDISPAINAGNEISGFAPLVDILALPRPQGGKYDMGAFEQTPGSQQESCEVAVVTPCTAVLSSLNVTLDGNCQFNLTPQTVAAGPCTFANYRVVVQDNNQSNGGTIDCAGTWTYGLFDTDGHLVAWGKVTAEDKTAPLLDYRNFLTDTLACFDVNYVLNNPQTIGNVGQTASPKPAATSPQTILYAEGPNAPANTTDDKIKNLGYPYFEDNCKSCGCRVTLKWSDKVVYYGCDSISAKGIYARIYREWVATDCNGMRSSVVQVIPFARPKVVLANQCVGPAPFSTDNELKFRGSGTCGADATVEAANYDWVVQYTSCTPDKSLIKKVDVMPSFRSYFYNPNTKRDIYLDEAECNYSVQIKDTEFPTCGGKGLKISREIYVFDWCAGGVVDTLYVLIKITDDQAPTLTAPEFKNGAPYFNPTFAQLLADTLPVISTGPMDCTAAIPTTVAGIKKTFGYTIADNCSLGNVTMSVKTKDRYVKGILVAENTWDKVDYAILNNSMIGLPTGKHRLIIDMSDGCYNAKRDSFDFYVYDGIAPVMKCDNQLNVSLSNGNGYTTGYAQVRVADLNEGSWDNCKIDWIKARRNVPAALAASFIAKGYDSNNNGKLDPAVGNDINADGDYNDVINGVEEVLKAGADGIDINGDGDFEDFGETFVLKGGKLMTPLTDVVEFFCGDVAEKVVVELWGQDISEDENRSFCWEEILVEDKVAPTCVAPFDLTIDCTEKCLEKIDDKAVSAACFGDVEITSGNDCAAMDTVYSVKKDLKCGYGTIIRSWALTKQTAKGPITINCAQTILVRPRESYNITFPKDAIANCKQPIVDTVIVDDLACDILAVNVSDKRYDASNDECYKIFRTYTVMNWCSYNDVCDDAVSLSAGSDAYVVDRGTFGNYGKAALNVLIRDENREAEYGPEFWISKDLTPGNTGDEYYTFYDELAMCPYNDLFDEYTYFQAFQYTQIIKVYDDVRPVVKGDAAKFCIRDGGDCLANLKMVINGTDNCSDKVTLETNVLMIAPYQTLDASKMIMYSSPKWSTVDKGNGDFEINVKDLAPLGTHDLIVVVRDECGNLSVPTRIPFTIADCKGPAPICINGLSTDLMSDGNGAGMMAVWASDFVASKVYDCNGQGPEVKDGLKLVTKYSLNRVGDKKDKNATGINLTCADKGKVILVELHAWDEVGNDDFCVTYVEVQDNRNVCPGSTTGGSFNIAGTISTEGTANLQGASITLSGQTSMSATTTANGAYSFVNLAKGGDFTIAPQLDKNHLNGVSTFDLVLIQKHILGVVALNSPYKMIAADVNNSKSITTLDLIVLRKLILNIDQSFQNNTSWRFVDATYQFPNASNPWAAAFPEVVSVNDLAANTTANFVAIKVGDVNASATVSSATAAEVRTAGTLEINAAEAALKAGQEYSVEFSTADLKNVQGYQFALNLDKRKVELVDIVYGVAKAENFGVFASEGIITTSWNSEAKQGALFTLVLRAKADAQLSNTLSLNRIVAPEAYNSNNDQLDLALTFNKVAVSNGFELKQNTPNPFNGETLINFNLPKATAATLTISDVTGRILKTVRANYAKGTNQVTLKASDLNASGVLYYTLEAEDFTATKKMILVRE